MKRNAIVDFFFGAYLDDRELSEQYGKHNGEHSLPVWQLAVIGVVLLVGLGAGAKYFFG